MTATHLDADFIDVVSWAWGTGGAGGRSADASLPFLAEVRQTCLPYSLLAAAAGLLAQGMPGIRGIGEEPRVLRLWTPLQYVLVPWKTHRRSPVSPQFEPRPVGA